MKRFQLLSAFLIILAYASISHITLAETYTEINDEYDPEAPYFEVTSGGTFPLKSTSVSASLSGMIGYVTLVQTYRNEGTDPIEARYVFPASTRAAVHNATLTIGDETIKAEIKKKDEAVQIYQRALASGNTASLLTQERPNAFEQLVGNIPPGTSVQVSLTYSEELVQRNGLYHFTIPAVVGPRYTGEERSPSAFRTQQLSEEGTLSSPTSIDVHIEGGTTLSDIAYSDPSASISMDETQATIKTVYPIFNKDFEVSYRLRTNEISSGIILHEGQKENFFLLSFQPPKEMTDDRILPREFQFIVDVSGSMQGFPLDTAKALLRNIFSKLNDRDSFNVRLFAGGSSTIFSSARPATKENIKYAFDIIESTSGGGGTNLLAALQETFNTLPYSSSHDRSIVMITDGFISVEKEAFDLIRRNLTDANLFSFGIGTSVNRHLIEGLAHVGHGSPFVVSSPEESKPIVEEFVDLVRSPVLHDITLKFNGIHAYAVEPKTIPTLFANQPIYVYGKWYGEPSGTIDISANSANGKYHNVLKIQDHKNRNNPALPYLWARKRLQLLDDYRFIGVDQKEKATDLALKYSLLSEYTSFVAVSKYIRTRGNPEVAQQPAPLPSGVSQNSFQPSGDRSYESNVYSFDTGGYGAKANYNDARIAEGADIILTLINSSLGALIMVTLGISAILLAAFGFKNRTCRWLALGSALGAIASFVVRSMISTWFNDSGGLMQE